jgi:hypothetical protein
VIRPAAEINAMMNSYPCLRAYEGDEPMMDRVVERIVEHVVIVALERDGAVTMHRYAGGITLRAIAEQAIEDFHPEAEDAPPAAIWGRGRLYASINEFDDRAKLCFYVCPHCLKPGGDAIPLHEWMLSMAGASVTPHRRR